MCGVVGALSAFYHDSTDISDPHQRMIASHRMIAKMPTIAAWAYKYALGQPFIYPRNDLSYAEDFVHMMFATPCEQYVVKPVVARAMDRILTLHADHEQNALDIDREACRIFGSQSVCMYSGWYSEPLGSGTWRRQ